MKIYKKPLILSVVLLVYVTGMVLYFAPRNTVMSPTEKIWSIVVSYVLVVILWAVMQYREKLREQRKYDDNVTR